MEIARVRVQLEQRGYSSRRLQKQLQTLCHTHPDLYNRAPAFLLSQMEIYYNIHRRVGLLPYPAQPLVLLPEHILPAVAAAN